MFRVQKSVQQVGPSTDGTARKTVWVHASLISSALVIMVRIFLKQIITEDETWVHQYCPETKAQSMAWKHPVSPTIKKFKTSTSSGKLMATVFWDMHGVLLLHFSPPNGTVNSAAYQPTLKKVKSCSTQEASDEDVRQEGAVVA